MNHRSRLIVCLLLLTIFVLAWGNPVSADVPAVRVEVVESPSVLFDGDEAVIAARLSNLSYLPVKEVVLNSSSGESTPVGTLLPFTNVEVYLYITEYQLGINEIDIYATYSEGQSDCVRVKFDVRPSNESITLRVVDAPTSIYEGMDYTPRLEVQNLRSEAVAAVRIIRGTEILQYVGPLAAYETRLIALQIQEYDLGNNIVELAADHEWGVSQSVTLKFTVRPAGESIALRVTDAPTSIYYGGVYEAQIEVHNLRPETVPWVTISSNDEVLYYVGSLAANELRKIELRIEEYEVGTNEVKLTAEHQWGRTHPLSLNFEVRPQGESVALRVIEAPASIYEGEIYEALIEVKNLRLEPVSRIFIKSGEDVVYFVGALDGDEEREIELQLVDYKIGENQVILEAESESGHSEPVLLEFDVIASTTAVRVYLASSNSPVYVAEELQFSVVVAASEDADITELELIALDERVHPSGYYLGEQVAAQEEIEPIELESLLALTQGVEEEEEPERAVKGRELSFNVRVTEPGSQSFDFQISYRLGSAVVRHEFVVSAEVILPTSVKLIQAERVTVSGDEETTVTLHVANGLPFDVEAVSVVPVGSITTSPSEFFVGQMAPDDFLPAFFKVSSDDLKGRDELLFKVVYRIGRQTYETTPLRVAVDADRSEVAGIELYIIPIIILAVIIIGLLSWRVMRYIRRKRMRPNQSLQ